jgi:hypothetical protein
LDPARSAISVFPLEDGFHFRSSTEKEKEKLFNIEPENYQPGFLIRSGFRNSRSDFGDSKVRLWC